MNGVDNQQKRGILLLYPYYWPLYKAGGPVQSLFNLAGHFSDKADFFIISLDRDIDGQPVSQLVAKNKWNKGPQGENIYFTSRITPWLLLRLTREISFDVIFVNGIFNVSTTLPGIFLGKLLTKKIVISPRGMLQPWALQRNKVVKRCFLLCLKIILRKEVWHATDVQEKADILRTFGQRQQVTIAGNIPRKVSAMIPVTFPAEDGKIKLVFLSLINRNKNLHLVIDQVKKQSALFTLDIYGPIIDEKYWDLCKSMINDTAISYKGAVPSWDVPDTLKPYHFFILPTEGENFGHAIFDSLSTGVPVLISRNTPWKNVDTVTAGFYIDSLDNAGVSHVLDKVKGLSFEQYKNYRMGSVSFAVNYHQINNYDRMYAFLFNSSPETSR